MTKVSFFNKGEGYAFNPELPERLQKSRERHRRQEERREFVRSTKERYKRGQIERRIAKRYGVSASHSPISRKKKKGKKKSESNGHKTKHKRQSDPFGLSAYQYHPSRLGRLF